MTENAKETTTYPMGAPDGRQYPFTVPKDTPKNVVIEMFKKQWKPIGQKYPHVVPWAASLHMLSNSRTS